ncbi:tetraspanin-8-like [Pristis pectinata]|uniref:tetraspanin-8-like n=1 Tax=Pristis pectinata TaxID=685728 RepID=UPI00223CCBB1|nr:tetraspanin-8-like [Pristis pectinata]
MAGVSTCIKYSMFFFNFLFWLCGSIILGVSIWLRVSKEVVKQIGDVNISEFYAAINVLIAVGAIIMVLGFLGCCGAIKESKCMLLLFFIGLLLILAIQITAGVLGAVYKSQVESTLQERYKQLVPLNNQPEDIKKDVEALQKANKCCGLVNGHQDWTTVPVSCNCDEKDSNDCTVVNGRHIWAKSCVAVLTDILKDNLVIIIGIAFGLALVEIFGLIFSMTLYCQIKNK